MLQGSPDTLEPGAPAAQQTLVPRGEVVAVAATAAPVELATNFRDVFTIHHREGPH